MNRVLAVNYDDRFIRVEAGVTNLSVNGGGGGERLLLWARPLLSTCLHDRSNIATTPEARIA